MHGLTARRARHIRNDLYALLQGAFPNLLDNNGFLQVPRLAQGCLYSCEGTYKWLRSDRISITGAKRLMALQRRFINEDGVSPTVILDEAALLRFVLN